MEAKIRLKVACDKAAYDAQWRLLDGAVPEQCCTRRWTCFSRHTTVTS